MDTTKNENMRNLLLLISSGLLILSCGVSKKNYQSDATSLIKMSKGVCFGACPFYDITIDGTGKATYVGKKFVEKIGTYTKTFSPEETNLLFQKFKKADFWAFADEYTEEVTDLPTTFITFEHKGQSKRIKSYYGTPEALLALINEVDAYSNTEGWKQLD